LGIVLTLVMVRMMGLRSFIVTGELEDFRQVMQYLNMGSLPLMPNTWLLEGMVALNKKDYGDYLYWLLMLGSTALALLQFCFWLSPRLYYRGWLLARETSSARRQNRRKSIFDFIDKGLHILPRSLRALVSKDIKTFWRDPAQWSQLIILFGLLFIYIINLRTVANRSMNVASLIPLWKVILSFFNMGAACFVLSILTTRFVYPMLSLEGKQFWTIGLAPIRRETIVWEKFWLCWFTTFLLSESLMIFSNISLQVGPFVMILSTGTILIMSFGLTSLAVGFGALTPNFKEDNPARIANGLGGTLNVILSLIYIGSVIALEAYPTFFYVTHRQMWMRQPPGWILLFIAVFIIVNAAAIVLPMFFGLRRWRKIEF